MQTNPRQREEEQQNTNSHKAIKVEQRALSSSSTLRTKHRLLTATLQQDHKVKQATLSLPQRDTVVAKLEKAFEP